MSVLSIRLSGSVLVLSAFGMLAMSGCQKSESADASANTPSVAGKNDSNSALSESISSEVKPLSLSELPASLKTDAFEYYGLGKEGETKFSVVNGENKTEASTKYMLVKVDGDKAEFKSVNSGALAELGEVTYELSPQGIKVTKSSSVTPDPNSYELVTGLSTGKSWPFSLKASGNELSGTNTVKGTESVKTSVGEYKDALVIETVATGKGSEPISVKMKQWFVKGRGVVKSEIKNTIGKQTSNIKMEELN